MLNNLELPIKVLNTMKYYGIESVFDFMKKKPREILRMRGIGAKYVQEKITKLKILNMDYIQYHIHDFDKQTAKLFGIPLNE